MDQDSSMVDFLKDVNEDEDIDAPPHLDDESFAQMAHRVHRVTKHLHAAGEKEYAVETQKLFLASRKLRQEYHNAMDEMENMKSEIGSVNHRLTQAATLSKVDHFIIRNLREETETAWKQTDAAHFREQKAHEQLYLLREKLDALEEKTEKTSRKAEIDDDRLDSRLLSHKDSILKERDRLSAEVEELKRRLKIQRLYTDEIERKRAETEEKNKELYRMLDDVSGQADKRKRDINAITDRLAVIEAENIALSDELKESKRYGESVATTNAQQNIQIITLKSNLERTNTQCTNVSNKLTKYQVDLEQFHDMKAKLQTDLNQKIALLKQKDEELVKLKQELPKVVKVRDILVRKVIAVEKAKKAIEADLAKLKAVATIKSKQESINIKATAGLEKKMQMCIRERNTVQNEIPRMRRKIIELEEALLLSRNEIKSMKDEIKHKEATQQKQKTMLSKIEGERDRKAEETQALEDKIDILNEEIRLKEAYIAELKEGAGELNTSLIKMQALFETARMERNSFENNLQSCMEEKEDFKAKLAIANRNAEHGQETIRYKEMELLRQQKNLEKLEKEYQKAHVDLRNSEIILHNTRRELREKRQENERLYRTLSDDEIRLDKIRKQYDFTNHEKDTIGSQLIRRNNEICLLKEKIHVFKLALDRGEKQYAERIEDIRLLKIEIRNLRSQRNILTRGLSNSADMRQEILQLHRIINQERVRAKAMEEEAITPMNIHRWRKLSGKDPEKLGLISKIHCLQRRILAQTVQATEREEAIQESQRLHNILKEFMLKLPSYKVKERLVQTQIELRARNKKLKALTAELNAKTLEIENRECTVDELQFNIESAKKDLFKEKKEKQKLARHCKIVSPVHSEFKMTQCP